ncbi:MAG: transposase family protein [Spirosomataceae bacterium]
MNRRKKHNLLDILVISVCAFVCGADDFEDRALYGTQKGYFLRTTPKSGHKKSGLCLLNA